MIRGVFFAFVLVLSAFSVQASEVVNINSADAATIEHELKGIGAAKAQAIVKYRQQNGPYKSVDELANVSGIGGKTLEKIRDRIRVSNADKTPD